MAEIDTTKVGVAAASLMEKLAADYPDGASVTEVMVIVEMRVPDEEEPGEYYSPIDWWCSNERRTVQVGMLSLAEKLFNGEWTREEDDD